tara:strand:- start:498 stop:1112 length:615 start_codon:yes stop_codon:yes gene_type:complete
MPYGYLGQTPNQQLKNSGVFSVGDAKALTDVGQLGGSLELIQEQTFSGDTNVDFTNIQGGAYDVHFMTYNFTVGTDNKRAGFRLFENGSIEEAGVYQVATQSGNATGSFSEVSSTSSSDLRAINEIGGAADERGSGYAYFYNLNNSSEYSFMTFNSTATNIAGVEVFEYGGGALPQASLVDGIRLFGISTTITGIAKLYGVKQI